MAKVKKPTAAEVEAEVKKLQELAPKIRQVDFFGGSNRAKIQAEINVLQNNLDEDDIYDTYGGNPDVESSALYVAQWRDEGSEDGAASEGWVPLVKG